MVLQLLGKFTMCWPDGAGGPLTLFRTYTIGWDASTKRPKEGAHWSLSGMDSELQKNEDRSDSEKGPAALEPRF